MIIAAMDFVKMTVVALEPDQLETALASGAFCWIDMDAADLDRAEMLLKQLNVAPLAISEALGPDCEGRYDTYEECLHFSVTDARREGGQIATAHVDAILGMSYLVTLHKGDPEFIRQMKKNYREDFLKYAKTPGFLLYDMSDHLVEGYRKTLLNLTDISDQLQRRLFNEAGNDIFKSVADLAVSQMAFRKIILAAREMMHELSSRKSSFVSETTQPFLERKAQTLERLAADLTVEREALNNALSLYMGMVSHKTNIVVNRLTVISMIFLPLTFLCGVYGMNFEFIPELKWRFGYAGFWLAVATIVALLWLQMKRRRWI